MFDRALQVAKLQDEKFEKTGKLVEKLHGVPVSVKDYVDVKGDDFTSSYYRFLFDACDEDAVIIQKLEKQGAIAFVLVQAVILLDIYAYLLILTVSTV
jgi:amidase